MRFIMIFFFRLVALDDGIALYCVRVQQYGDFFGKSRSDHEIK